MITAAHSAADMDAVRALFLEYADSLGFSLAYQDFETELAQLPGKYAPPSGALLLACVDDVPVGVVALRALTAEICEMKRLYVKPPHRGLRPSIGRALVDELISEARRLGYRCLRLDTVSSKMRAAIQLYRSLGFEEIPAYYASPITDTTYFQLDL